MKTVARHFFFQDVTSNFSTTVRTVLRVVRPVTVYGGILFFFFENVRFRYLLRFAVCSIYKNMPARYISSFSSSANTDAVMVAARRFSTSGWSDMCNAVVVSFAVVVRTPYRNLCAPYTHVRCRADIWKHASVATGVLLSPLRQCRPVPGNTFRLSIQVSIFRI